MEIFNSLKTFLYTHRKKFIISGIVVGGTVAVVNYLRQQELERQKYKITELLESTRRQRHFDTIQTTCDQTILSIGKRLEENIVVILDVDLIVSDLKKNPVEKISLWEDLKVAAFTEICLMVYAHTLLVFVLKIQFAIIGGYLYKNLNDPREQLDRNQQERYLSLYMDFINTGLYDLRDYIKSKVSNIVSGLELKKKLSIQNIQDIFWSIQTAVANDELIERLPNYLRIQTCMETTSEPVLLQMYEETGDILCTKELTLNCVNSLLNCGFSYVTRELLSILERSNLTNDKALPTVKMIPILHKLIKSKPSHGDTNLWLKNLMASEKLKILCANIYESYC